MTTQRPISWITLALALGVAGALAVAMAVGASAGNGGDGGPVRSDEGIDPQECNWVHNIDACPGERPPLPRPSAPGDSGEPPPPAPQDKGLVRVPAPIDGVELRIAESYPPQYFLEVVAGLPSGCAEPAGYQVERTGDVIRVGVFNLRPADEGVICTMIYGTTPYTIPLGSDFEPGKTYTVYVNQDRLSFTAQ